MKIAILGFGVVGKGVYDLLEMNGEHLEQRTGQMPEVKYIFDRKAPEGEARELLQDNLDLILADPEVEIVVEAMGGIEPAFTFVAKALCSGKSVVTSNKELVAEKGDVLLAMAKTNDVSFLFEASVAGGTPVLHPIYRCLMANKLQYAYGILNGTTNFILTKMIKEGMSFAPALEMAQKLGYAEADPTADVEGIDACRKVCILASLMFGRHVYPKSAHTEGITKITAEDVAYADAAGYAVKLIGQTRQMENGKVLAMVTPAFVPFDNLLSKVDDVFNAVLVGGDAVGDVLFSGRGAGALPTASAVVSDITEIGLAGGRVEAMGWQSANQDFIADPMDCELFAYVRAIGADENTVKKLFVGAKLLHGAAGEVAFITDKIKEGELCSGIAELKRNGADVKPYIRILGDRI